MRKKTKLKFYLCIFSPIYLSPILTSCQSSFWDQQNIFESEFHRDFFRQYSLYKGTWEKILNFVKDEKNINSYYLENYKKVKEIDDAWRKTIDVITEKGNRKNLLNEKYYYSSFGYFDENNNFNETDIFSDNKKVNIVHELTKDPEDKSLNIRTMMTYISYINYEMNSIIQDWIKRLENDSVFYLFYRQFINHKGWPFFRNHGSRGLDRQKVFFDNLIGYSNRMESEFQSRYYDSSRIKVDYKKIINSNPEENYGHSHALINLWNEWNGSIVPKINEKNHERIWDNNLIYSVVNFFKSIYKKAEKIKLKNNANLILRLQNKTNSEEIIDLDIKKLFDNFLLQIVDDFENWNIKIYYPEKDYRDLEYIFKDNFEELMSIASKIERIINNYKN
ncbi:MAG0770 family lipoprotein [Mycoplasma tauri]|uniref:MAG0770 family lipoprotein n=1 Tax=Mycoplasma tauri TaxID=547987 RepID=UPI0019674BD2|nr:hypothetical protein [Mycoplasma tauri]MBZ4204333.1 hypothetical protein [Mycoplasma tauri]MBZ4226599.1 hypothetical protein [Mycoplasma tauri]QSB07597.1 hypothetical protein JS510_00510 [Mycoplasma tauri]